MKSWRKWLSIGLIMALILCAVVFISRPDDKVHVYFLNVGQGDAILIRQGSTDILIDGGPSPQAILTELGQIMPFWDRNIELVVMTHPHTDHISGLVEVLKRYKVEQVLYPMLATSDETEYDRPLFDEWLKLIEEKDIKTTLARRYQQASVGEIIIDILNPPAIPLSGTESDVDNNSVVLQMNIGEVGFLFTGDIMREAEHELVYERLASCVTILKVAHHGSKTSTTDEFLNVVMPQIAVISVGENDYGHPSMEVLGRLAGTNIYRTDSYSTIEFITDGQRLWMK
jgi:competence protein ComEC